MADTGDVTAALIDDLHNIPIAAIPRDDLLSEEEAQRLEATLTAAWGVTTAALKKEAIVNVLHFFNLHTASPKVSYAGKTITLSDGVAHDARDITRIFGRRARAYHRTRAAVAFRIAKMRNNDFMGKAAKKGVPPNFAYLVPDVWVYIPQELTNEEMDIVQALRTATLARAEDYDQGKEVLGVGKEASAAEAVASIAAAATVPSTSKGSSANYF